MVEAEGGPNTCSLELESSGKRQGSGRRAGHSLRVSQPGTLCLCFMYLTAGGTGAAKTKGRALTKLQTNSFHSCGN